MNLIDRRNFLGTMAAGAIACATTSTLAQTQTKSRYKIIGFSKPFQDLGHEETADTVAEIGWDGIECPVRSKGQIEPERAPDELPRLVEALKKRDRDVSLLATDITSVSEPHTEKVLRTAARLGIKRYRLGSPHY